MCRLSDYFEVLLLILSASLQAEAKPSACEQKEKHLALLDLAKESISKAKDLQPDCFDGNNEVSANSSECGTKEKISAFLDIATDLIENAKQTYSTCDIVNDTTIITKPLHERPIDCSEVLENGEYASGVYTIWPRTSIMKGRSIKVYCDMDTDGGGWTVIQRRGNFSQKVDFYQDWENYKNGFGDITGEFWIGNDIIFAVTNQRHYSARFDMENVNGEFRYAAYSNFWIENEAAGYLLHFGNYDGTAGDGITTANNMKFSTKDRRNDRGGSTVCAENKRSGFWFNGCTASNPNGLNHPDLKNDRRAMNWHTWTKYDSLWAIDIKLR